MPHTNEDTEKEIENEEAQTEDLQPNLQTGSITEKQFLYGIHKLYIQLLRPNLMFLFLSVYFSKKHSCKNPIRIGGINVGS